MKEPHRQSHVRLQDRGHLANKKRYTSTFTRPMVPIHRRVVTQDKGNTPTKSCGHMTYKKRYISIFTMPMAPKISRMVTQNNEITPTKSRDTSITWSRET